MIHGGEGLLKDAWRTASVAGFAAGVLSVALLLQQGLLIDFVAPLRIMAEWYDAAITFLLSPLKPVMLAIASFLQRISADYALSPTWRHHLVAGTVILGGCLRAGRGYVYRFTGATVFVIAVLTAFQFQGAPGLALGGLLFGTVLVTCFGRALFGSLWRMRKNAKPPGPDDMLWKDAWAMTVNILAVVFGGAIFVALNAGLKLAGL
jgi:hypothetical protein